MTFFYIFIDNIKVLTDIKQKLDNNIPKLHLQNISIPQYIKSIGTQDFLVENMNEHIQHDNVECIQNKSILRLSNDNLTLNQTEINCTTKYTDHMSEKSDIMVTY